MILDDLEILKKLYEQDKDLFVKNIIDIFKPDCDLQLDLANKIVMAVKNKNQKIEYESRDELYKTGNHLSKLCVFISFHAWQYDTIMDSLPDEPIDKEIYTELAKQLEFELMAEDAETEEY